MSKREMGFIPVRYDIVRHLPDGTEDVWFMYNKGLAEEALENWQKEFPSDRFEIRENM